MADCDSPADVHELLESEQAVFISNLSKLATNGEYDNIFGSPPDFNRFFDSVITTINLAGKWRSMLIKHGIDPHGDDYSGN